MVVLCNYQLQPRGVPGGGREENVSEVSNWKYHYPLHIVAFSISLPDVTAKKTFLKTHPQKKRTFWCAPPIKCFKCQPFSVMIFRLGHWKPFTNFLSNFPELLWTIFTFLYPTGWVYLLFVCSPSINVDTVLCGPICVCVFLLLCFVLYLNTTCLLQDSSLFFQPGEPSIKIIPFPLKMLLSIVFRVETV